MNHKQMVGDISPDLRFHIHRIMKVFRRNGTRNCKYKRETEIDFTLRCGFAISGNILQKGLITSRNLTESRKRKDLGTRKRRKRPYVKQFVSPTICYCDAKEVTRGCG